MRTLNGSKAFSMVRSFAFIIGMIPISGCASWLAPQPPAVPTPPEVRAYFEQVKNLQTGTTSTTDTASAVEVATAGYTLVDAQCDAFFSSVTRMSYDTSFNGQEVTLGGALAAGTLAAIKASAKSIALTALAGTFIGSSLNNFQNFALLTPYPNQVHKLVTGALSAYAQSAPPSDSIKMKDVPTALRFVSGYASLCTYAGIGDLVAQALQKAKTADVSGSPTVVPAPLAPPLPGAPLVVAPNPGLPRIEVQ